MRSVASFPKLPGIEILAEVGRGAHAVVYKARRGERTLAVKIQREAHARPEEAVRFRREAALLASMRHPALPTILDVGDYQGRPWLVMDFAEGETLASLLAEGPLSEERIVAIARDLAGALAEVHGHGLVHRDVKPDNVLIGPGGGARLLDFGLATRMRPQDTDGEEESRGGEVAGTFLYAAPEQTGMLKRQVDGRSDLYALGVLLYECATCRPPFLADDVSELLRQHAARPVPDVRIARPDLSEVLARMIERLLAKDPDDRYQSGKGLLADLLRIDTLARQGEGAVLGARDGTQVLFETPVVGCDLELDLLQQRQLLAKRGQGGAVLLEGPAGYGKTRLLRELVERSRGGDPLVLQARCARGDPTPFGVLREAVEGWLRRCRQLPQAAREAEQARLVEAAGAFGPLLGRFSPMLAQLLPEVVEASDGPEAQEPFYQAVAGLLVGLARTHGAALLVIDDVEWLDEASRQVLGRLVPLLPDAPLLLAAAGGAGEAGLRQFVADVGGSALRLHLRGLDEQATRELIAHQLGSDEIPDALVQAVSRRAEGAPFAIVESVSAMLDAGLLAPDWEGWRVDVEGLEALALPADVTELIARRVESLSDQARPLLRATAVWGSGITREDLAAITGASAEEVDAALDEALRAHLVERHERGRIGFVHERVRAALLAELGEEAVRSMHRAIAACLQARPTPEPAAVYALARHLELGGGDDHLVAQANLEAGRLALKAYANEEAHAFLAVAEAAAERAGLGEGAELAEALGTASARAGRFRDAVVHLERALALATRRRDRARLHASLAEVRLALHDTAEAWGSIRDGFRALRRPYPTGSAGSWLVTLALAALGTLLHLLRIGHGSTSAGYREQHAILARLSNLGSRLGNQDGRMGLMVQMTLVPLYSIHRLGESRELIGAYCAQAVMVSRYGPRWLAEYLSARARKVAEQLQDRVFAARARVFRALAANVRGESCGSEEIHRRNFEENGAWLDAGDFQLASTDLANNLLLRGHARKAWAVVEKALIHTERQEADSSHPLPCAATASLSILGKVQEAGVWLQRCAERVEDQRAERWQLAAWLEAQLFLLLEQGEVGSQVDEAIARHRALGFEPDRAPYHRRIFWVVAAHARLQQLGWGGSVEALREDLEALKEAASTPVLRGHAAVIAAGLALAEGQLATAGGLLARAEAIARTEDAPWILFEALRLRARLLLAEEGREQALREARLAEAICLEQSWRGRARAVAREFGLSSAPAPSEASTGSHSERSSAAQLKLERQLEALLQVSRACASVLEPDRVAEVALDEIVRILGAERALLFLGKAGGELERRAARAAEESGEIRLDDYSSTVVRRVWTTRQPLVLSSVEESHLGASVVAHDLRSILAVPLLARDVAIGVIYVDNRLARGIFGRDDVAILGAIASQIASALETARAAQLEIERKALENDLEQAFEQATTDALTGLRNRRYLEERIEAELARARRGGGGLSLLLLDIDHFKQVNDVHGHLAGDRVLARVGAVLREAVRATDLAARYGGEEFCVVAADTDAQGAVHLAERIRAGLQAQEIPVEGGVLRVTASLGVAAFGSHGTDRAALLRAADQALYAAKEGGRNQVRIAPQPALGAA